MNERIRALQSFLDASHSMYHAQNYIVETLKAEGYVRLPENESWQLLEEPIQSKTAFAGLPNLKPSFFTNNLKLGDDYTANLTAVGNKEALFFYSAPADVNVAITLGTTSKSEESAELKIITSPDRTKSAAILPPLPKGEYILRIYSGYQTSLLECSADFIINID